MRTHILTAAITLIACSGPIHAKDPKPAPSPSATRAIDLAICLDTSGSMSGLIESAKQKLWAIVNDLALADPAPRLRVALLTYGNNGHAEADGWVRVDSRFTEDLDTISQQLFELRTNGGEEYVGRVLQSSNRLDWHPSDDTLKLVLVAGNESADQDRTVPFRDICRKLISRGVMVNSIYCGPREQGIAELWPEIASLTDGHYASIDKDNGMVIVETPFDAELSTLSITLNTTYIPFGSSGSAGFANQQMQDTNASSLNSAASASRALTKAQSLYVCAWDLVDATRRGDVQLAEVAAEDLPEAMKSMTPEERVAHVEAKSVERAEIQARITELTKSRAQHVAELMKAKAIDPTKAFDHVLRRLIRAQAEAKGFVFASVAGEDKNDSDANNDEEGRG